MALVLLSTNSIGGQIMSYQVRDYEKYQSSNKTRLAKKSANIEEIERDFYETKPYIFAFFSLLCFYNKASGNDQLTSILLTISGILFAISAAGILYHRFFSRNYR